MLPAATSTCRGLLWLMIGGLELTALQEGENSSTGSYLLLGPPGAGPRRGGDQEPRPCGEVPLQPRDEPRRAMEAKEVYKAALRDLALRFRICLARQTGQTEHWEWRRYWCLVPGTNSASCEAARDDSNSPERQDGGLRRDWRASAGDGSRVKYSAAVWSAGPSPGSRPRFAATRFAVRHIRLA